MSILDKHAILERNATLLLVGSLLVVTIGGIVEIAPLFYLENTIEDVKGVRPYTPLELAGRKDAFERAEAELTAVGLGARMHHYPAQMSGGEQQRVALARAAAPRPAILLADEPTGNLDGSNGQAIMDLLFGLRDRHGATLVLVTHSPELAARCDRVIHLRDGRIETETRLEAAQ